MPPQPPEKPRTKSPWITPAVLVLLITAVVVILISIFLFLPLRKQDEFAYRIWDEIPSLEVHDEIMQYGGWEQTRTVYDSLLSQARKWGDSAEENHMLLKIGVLHESIGNLDSAVFFFDEAVQAPVGPLSRATALLRLGMLHGKLGDVNQAEACFAQAHQTGGAAWGDSMQARYLSGRGNLQLARARYDEAIAQFQQALQLYQTLRLKRGEWVCLAALGLAHFDKGDTAAAQMWYRRADSSQWSRNDAYAAALNLLHRAELERAQKQYGAALQKFRAGRALIVDLSGHELERAEVNWEAWLGEARCLWQLGKLQSAKLAAEESVTILEQQMLRVSGDALKRNYFEQRRAPFAEVIGIYLGLRQYREALAASERARARAFLDLLQERGIHLRAPDEEALAPLRKAQRHLQLSAAGVERTIGNRGDTARVAGLRGNTEVDLSAQIKKLSPELRSLSSVAPVRFDALVRLAREKQTTLVEYFVLPDSLAIFVITPQGKFACHTTKVSRDSLNASVTQLLENLTAPEARTGGRNVQPVDTASTYDPALAPALLQQLYRWLIAPIAAYLPGDTNQVVTIVPHGALFLVPFSALLDHEQKYLMTKHPLAMVPAAGVLQFTGQKRGVVVSPHDPYIFVIGDPRYPEDSRLQPLPGARAEAQAIRRYFPENRRNFLQGDSAVESQIKSAAPAFTILHFATHGLLNESAAMLSALAFAADSHDDGFLTCAEIFGLEQLHADLIVLSACQTGRGEITGDGILGLSRAFIYAGTPALIATQWSIADESTAYFMSAFYEEYRRHRRKALALRRAQLRTFARYPAPFYWAAFILIGED